MLYSLCTAYLIRSTYVLYNIHDKYLHYLPINFVVPDTLVYLVYHARDFEIKAVLLHTLAHLQGINDISFLYLQTYGSDNYLGIYIKNG